MGIRRGRLAVTALVAVGAYLVLWVGYAQAQAWVTTLDMPALAALHRFAETRQGWVAGWNAFCTVLGPGAFRIATLVVILVALARRNVRLALFLMLSVEASGLLTEFAKALADRPRPETALVVASSTSFPSGHALGVMVAVLALLTAYLPVVAARYRTPLVLLAACVVLAIGVGRVVLNVHHPSDVLAGWALGYAWFVACVLLVPPVAAVTAADGTPEVPGSSR